MPYAEVDTQKGKGYNSAEACQGTPYRVWGGKGAIFHNAASAQSQLAAKTTFYFLKKGARALMGVSKLPPPAVILVVLAVVAAVVVVVVVVVGGTLRRKKPSRKEIDW